MIARTPLIILAVLVGLRIVASLISLHIGSAIFGGVILFIIAEFAIKLVNALIITPLKTARYKRAASTLAGQLQSVSELISFWRSWWSGAPGALAVTKLGHVVIGDRSTNYAQLWLGKSQIVNVSVEREATQVTNTKHGGRMTFGGMSNGLFGGYTMGGRSKSVTQTLETAFLEIRYQLEPNGYVSTVVIPFGSDRRAADELCAVVTRIEHTS